MHLRQKVPHLLENMLYDINTGIQSSGLRHRLPVPNSAATSRNTKLDQQKERTLVGFMSDKG
jgi:hypothetical protein